MVSHLKEYTLFKKENKFSKFNIKDSDDKDRWNINVIEGKLVDVKLEITFNIVSSSHSPLMLLELVNINRDDVISILGNADVTHGNGTEASDFDMRIGAEASHYFVYGKK
uniref:Uncharacterized protein n=1 Tax=Rhizophagus irregularis (strain DAOM 181602 / DAOM 197198 / MUCL 43194) TaxID=747089 RepID=U9T4H7_RHIID